MLKPGEVAAQLSQPEEIIGATLMQTDDGLLYVVAENNPTIRYTVVELIDRQGKKTDDFDAAVGGIVRWPDGTFGVFGKPEIMFAEDNDADTS